MTVLIKRYANRKLYNTQTSRYITLKGIAELLENDEDVRVIDNETGEDITSVALSQILVDSERSNPRSSGSLFGDLLHRGGDALYDAVRKGVDDASGSIDDFQRNVRRVIKQREEDASRLGDRILLGRSDVDRMVQNAMERVFKLLDLPRRSDIEALNRNLARVAEAIDRLDGGRPAEPDTEPDAAPAGAAAEAGDTAEPS